jgi:hypothetical protein
MKNFTKAAFSTTFVAIAAVSLLVLPAAQVAQAADLYGDGGDSYSYSYPDYSSGDSYSYSYPDSSGDSYSYSYPDYSSGDSYSYSYPDYSSGDSYSYSYPDSSGDSYSYSYPDYSSGDSYSYSYPDYSSSSYPPSYSYNYASNSYTYPPAYTYTYNYTTPTCTYNCNPQPQPKPKPQPTCTLNVDKYSINQGDSATLSWSTSNATSVSIGSLGSVNKSGSQQVSPGNTTTYVLNASGAGGSTSCSKTVTVNIPPPVYNNPTCTLTASPNVINHAGDPVTLSWNSTYATVGSISGIGSVNPSGSTTVYPSGSQTYTGVFTGQGGSVTCSTSVTLNFVPPPPPVYNAPTCWLNLSRTLIYGTNQPVVLSWGSSNANYGVINQGVGNVSSSGSRNVYPNGSTTYVATFYGYNGQTVTCSASVNVAYVPPPTNNTPYVTLSAVPYTGLDLGPVGTFLYWAFLVLWCFVAAYLIAVKKVQNKIYRWLKVVLFGDSTPAVKEETHTTSASIISIDAIAAEVGKLISSPSHKVAHQHAARHEQEEDKIDDFVLSQVNRPRHA